MRIIRIGNQFLSISSIGRTSKDLLVLDSNRLLLLSLSDIRAFHSSVIFYNEKDKQTTSSLVTTTNASTVVKRKSLRQRFVAELKHYFNGSKLLFIETKIASRLLKEVLYGHTLTRRERKQFARTAADLFRLVPFSVFIIVPFMEFTLPIFLKLFPNMLPSTFKEIDKEREKLKKQFKVKLEVAKFLQDTLEATALQSKKKRSDDTLPTQFVEFMEKIRSTGVQPSTEEIMKFSSLFENKSTLDNLDRPHLIALCKLLGISSIGPDYYLRYLLHLRLRHLEADDKLIQSEGIENLTVEELQVACRDRGMRSLGISIERLRSQLQQWLDLHLNKRISSTILLLSRALYLPESISQENVLKATIQSLPKAIDNVTAINLAKVSGEPVDNTQRIEFIKQEEAAIKKEREEKLKAKALNVDEIKKKVLAEKVVIPRGPLNIPNKEILVDRGLILDENKDEQNIDIGQLQSALQNLIDQKREQVLNVIERIQELKTGSTIYKDVKELATLVPTKEAKSANETRSAKALSKRINKIINDLDYIVHTLNTKQDVLQNDIKPEETLKGEVSLKKDQIQQHKDFFNEKRNLLVSAQELINTIRKIQKVSNQSTDDHIWDIIHQLDANQQGSFEVDAIIKELEIVGNEKIDISKKHLKEIINLVRKEHMIEKKAKTQLMKIPITAIEKAQSVPKNI